jgi:hypothetical protein
MDQVHFLNLEYFFNLVAEFFIELTSPNTGTGSTLGGALGVLGFLIRVVLPILIIAVIAFFIYYTVKIEKFQAEDEEMWLERIHRRRQAELGQEKNTRWDHVMSLFGSENPSDWRVAVIEADAMLEELVNQLGYEGESLGEKMKQINAANFPTIQQAWDAHNVRNRIAHEGMNFQLDSFEKNRVLKLYERVFSDAGFI